MDKAVIIKTGGSDEAVSIKTGGSDEAVSIKTGGSDEAVSIKTGGSDEAVSIKTGGSDEAVSIKTEGSDEVVESCEASVCIKTEPVDDDNEVCVDAGTILSVSEACGDEVDISPSGKKMKRSKERVTQRCGPRSQRKSPASLKLKPREDEESSPEAKPILGAAGSCEDQRRLRRPGKRAKRSEEPPMQDCSEMSETESSDGRVMYPCDICGRCFSTKQSRKGHRTAHFPEKLLSCDLCGNKFQTAHGLNRHKQVHVKGKAFQCEICGKSFTQKATVKVHQRIHTGEKPFVCEICGKGFPQSSGLRSHRRCHHMEGRPPRKRGRASGHKKTEDQKTSSPVGKLVIKDSDATTPLQQQRGGEEPHYCSICDKDFVYPSKYKIHIRSHNDDRPYACNLCDNRFLQKGSLKTHYMRAHMNLPLPAKRPSAQTVCPFCGKIFSYPCLLRVHLTVHTNEKAYCCDVCGKAYGHPSSLKKHQQIHKKSPLHCNRCNEGFMRKDQLIEHQQRRRCIRRRTEEQKQRYKRNRARAMIGTRKRRRKR